MSFHGVTSGSALLLGASLVLCFVQTNRALTTISFFLFLENKSIKPCFANLLGLGSVVLLDSVVRERCVCVCVLCYRSKRWISLLVLGFSVNGTLEVGWTRFNFFFFGFEWGRFRWRV